MKKKVFVGLSGGVDSSVAALLLKKEGYELTGVYMKNWSGEDYGLGDQCPWREDLEITQQVAKQLGIEHKIYNFEREYRDIVIKDFFSQYDRGRTPNPDILCNKHIKFELFLKRALEEGADFVATGHYAKADNGRLFRPKDLSKDQTYFLSALTGEQLRKVKFPLENLLKSEVRPIASEAALPNSDRPDSQGICFIGEIDIREFIAKELAPREGEIVDIDSGSVVGKHQGVWFYTEGQRKGLEIGGLAQPYFVARKDREKNILYVAAGRSNPVLWSSTIHFESLHTLSGTFDERNLYAQIRYRTKASAVEQIKHSKDGKGEIRVSDPQWSPSPGQTVVFYRENQECVGSATIRS